MLFYSVKPFRNDNYSLQPPGSSVAPSLIQSNMNTNANTLMTIGYPSHVINQVPPWQGRQVMKFMVADTHVSVNSRLVTSIIMLLQLLKPDKHQLSPDLYELPI